MGPQNLDGIGLARLPTVAEEGEGADLGSYSPDLDYRPMESSAADLVFAGSVCGGTKG